MALIELNRVSKKYSHGSTALRDITLDVRNGEFVYIVGPSGAGKSTLIRMLYREEEASRGSIKVGQFRLNKIKKRQIPILRRSIGVVFQDYKLLNHKTVYENVAFAMEVIGERPRYIKKRVKEVL
ncbi:cell division ATP-binding protein FtsE, partial [Streptococcus sobrinus]